MCQKNLALGQWSWLYLRFQVFLYVHDLNSEKAAHNYITFSFVYPQATIRMYGLGAGEFVCR